MTKFVILYRKVPPGEPAALIWLGDPMEKSFGAVNPAAVKPNILWLQERMLPFLSLHLSRLPPAYQNHCTKFIVAMGITCMSRGPVSYTTLFMVNQTAEAQTQKTAAWRTHL